MKKSNIDFDNHPCFSKNAHKKYGRVHLPVAPRCNVQCNFCNRKYDCINESRPGVTSSILTPPQALAYLEHVLDERPEISVVGIAGPGDPFANPDETMETLRLVRGKYPELILCVATNGLGVAPYVDELADLKVSHVSITITAIDPKIGSKIYAWVRDLTRPLHGEKAASLLISRQTEALLRLKSKGLVVKVNSILIPGVNDDHVPEIARQVGRMGVDIMNCIPLIPAEGSVFEKLPPPETSVTARVRDQAGRSLPQMTHCARCRADAVGLVGEQMTAVQITALQQFANLSLNPAEDAERPYVAVATREGALVNQHLGEADYVSIYAANPSAPGVFRLIENRNTPDEGGAEARWVSLANILTDCRAILVNAAGPTPKKILASRGLKVIEMEGLIEEGLGAVFAGKPIPASMKRRFSSCGAGISCKGTGTGCD